jgi:cobalamin biosynthesis Mg chelatase CobN
MYAHFSGDFVACGSFSGGVLVLESIDERKKGQQQLVPIAKQDAVRPDYSSSDEDDTEAPKGGKSRKKGGKKKGAGANIADAAAAAVSMVKRSLSPVRSPRAKKPDTAAKSGQKQTKQQKGSEDKTWIILAVVGVILAILGGFAATLLLPQNS